MESAPIDHTEDVDLSVQLNRWQLKPIGVWPSSRIDTKLERLIKWTINSIGYSLVMMVLVPCTCYTIFEETNTYNRIRLVGPMSFSIMAAVKYYTLIKHSGDIRECIELIERDWRTMRHANDRRLMIINALFGRRLILICSIFVYGSACFYYIAIPVATGKIPVDDDSNLTFIPLQYPFPRFVLDTRRSPVNEIIFSIQATCGFFVHNVTAAACGLAATFTMHACGQLEILMLWMQHLVQGREDHCKSVVERLRVIVKHHVRIRGFIELIERIVQNISLVEILGCTLNMCLLGFYMLTEFEIGGFATILTYFVIFVSMTFNIFMLCYIGELIAEQCERVGDVMYMTEWYRLPGKSSLALVLIINAANCKSSTQLTAGKFIVLSFSSFSDVVKTSFAYMNMLRKLIT